MSDRCDKCSVIFTTSESVVKCTECKLQFHPACTQFGSSEVFTKHKSRTWKCASCASDSASQKSSDGAVDDKKSILDVLAAMESRINNNITTGIDNVQKSINSLAENITQLNCKVEKIEENLTATNTRCDKLEQAKSELCEDMKGLISRQHDLEQHSRCANIEIQGFPQTANEDMYTVLEAIAKVIQVQFRRTDISTAHRLRLFSKKHQHAPIIVQFVARSVKEVWIVAARQRKRLNATEVNANLQASDVYINEHLTPHNKALLGRARRLQRQRKIFYAGYYNGKVLIKKREGDAAERILAMEDLDAHDN